MIPQYRAIHSQSYNPIKWFKFFFYLVSSKTPLAELEMASKSCVKRIADERETEIKIYGRTY